MIEIIFDACHDVIVSV